MLYNDLQQSVHLTLLQLPSLQGGLISLWLYKENNKLWD
jgi:hypothetical protein